MGNSIEKVNISNIQRLRALYLQEQNCQIRYDAAHGRGGTDSYLLLNDGTPVGYASVKGQEAADRDTVFEFYLVPHFRRLASRFYSEVIAKARATYLESQTNDALTTAMLYEFGENISTDTMLFCDFVSTNLSVPGTIVRPRKEGDVIFEHRLEPVGNYVVEKEGEVVATGGFLTHYNPPFADLYMEVREDSRRQGLGSLLLQHVKRACYEQGHVPAARCQMQNKASHASLLRAGLRVCAHMLLARLKTLA